MNIYIIEICYKNEKYFKKKKKGGGGRGYI
jgi:hypothetical protein